MAAAQTLPDPLPADPFTIFSAWFTEARTSGRQPNPDAMNLATVSAGGGPSARIVLCRGVNPAEGYIVFFTNYRGAKGRQLLATPRAAVTFHWDHADRQVRMEGVVVQSPPGESDAYFASRPWESRLSAWASEQSEPLESRTTLIGRVGEVIERLGLDPDEILLKGNSIHIPRPPHWGGVRLWAARVELWLGGPGRLHDRGVWDREISQKQGEEVAGSPWRSTRLQP